MSAEPRVCTATEVEPGERLVEHEQAQRRSRVRPSADCASEQGVAAIRHHHERFDGRGYPDGLAGSAIPLEASIIGLADAWDAMTTARPYSRPLPRPAALQQVRAVEAPSFRPDVVDALLSVTARLEHESPQHGRMSP
jgi:HD-GYP domain-containing protein (c-di-GMP phosphodiesterase class II)